MFADPIENIKRFELEEGMKVADFGAGSGFYALAAAKAVGSKGKIYAIDIQKDLLQKLRSAALHEHITNIEIIWGDVEKPVGTKLRENSIDAVILSNLLFQLADKPAAVKEIKRILAPKGKVLVIDWSGSYGGLGPAPDAVILPEEVRNLFTTEGFVFERDIPAGEHHFGMILRKI